jgi:threonylcarbamoyladenosine tRNA methylthiotransferase MtaB
LIRKYYPDAAITTDVIVGFPGETTQEFEECKKFLETVEFSSMHIFKYSKREGTKAAVMENQVSDELKAKRSDELLKLDSDLRIKYMEKFINKEVDVLFEKKVTIEGKEYFIGHTKEYVKIAVETNENIENKILSVKVAKILDSENMLAIF